MSKLTARKKRGKALAGGNRGQHLALCHGSVDETDVFLHDAFESDVSVVYVVVYGQ